MTIKQVRAKDLLRALQKAGFVIKRKSGSHIFLKLSSPKEKRTTSIAIHPGVIPKGTLRAIIKQAGLSEDELKKLLK